MADIVATKVNEVFLYIQCRPDISMDLHEYFTIQTNKAKFAKKPGWGGQIRLFRLDTRTLYRGLLPELRAFAMASGYTLQTDDEAEPNAITSEDIRKEFDYLLFEPHDFQLDAAAFAVNNRRALIISPTRSGKTLIAYFLAKMLPSPCLILVPTESLILQMEGDFANYGGPARGKIQKIKAKTTKDVSEDIVISTQASARNQPPEWFNQFGCIIADEVHEYEARTLKGMIEKASQVPYVFGMTGTLKDTKTSARTLSGMFGPQYVTATTKELMDRGIVSKLLIRLLVIHYPKEDRKAAAGMTYHEEMEFLTSHPKRNRILCELAENVPGNVLLMYFYVDGHGKVLYSMMESLKSKKKLHYVDGSVKGEAREKIRAAFEVSNDNAGITSYRTFSTGITISNLPFVILGSPSKARVRNLQTIGRSLGLHDEKEKSVVYDVVDDLRYEGEPNYTLEHSEERLVVFNQEGFDYEIHHVYI